MFCRSCRCHVTPAAPRTLWKFVNVLFWISSMAVATVFSLAIGLNLVLAPAAIMIGMSIGTSARRLNAWTCPRCDEELYEPEPETVLSPPPVAAPLTPARYEI